MKQLKHWQDVVNALLGIWVVLSPWALGFQDSRIAAANAVLVGVALIAAALGAMLVPRAWEEWTECALGVWLVISPWVLGFSALQVAMLAAVFSGIVIAALALWTLYTDKDYSSSWHRPAH